MSARKPKTEPFTFRGNPETIIRLRMNAKIDKMPIGVYINKILDQYLSNHAYAISREGENIPNILVAQAMEIMLKGVVRQIARASVGPISEEVAIEDFGKVARRAAEILRQISPPEDGGN